MHPNRFTGKIYLKTIAQQLARSVQYTLQTDLQRQLLRTQLLSGISMMSWWVIHGSICKIDFMEGRVRLYITKSQAIDWPPSQHWEQRKRITPLSSFHHSVYTAWQLAIHTITPPFYIDVSLLRAGVGHIHCLPRENTMITREGNRHPPVGDISPVKHSELSVVYCWNPLMEALDYSFMSLATRSD